LTTQNSENSEYIQREEKEKSRNGKRKGGPGTYK
jgi:hypothetical protein